MVIICRCGIDIASKYGRFLSNVYTVSLLIAFVFCIVAYTSVWVTVKSSYHNIRAKKLCFNNPCTKASEQGHDVHQKRLKPGEINIYRNYLEDDGRIYDMATGSNGRLFRETSAPKITTSEKMFWEKRVLTRTKKSDIVSDHEIGIDVDSVDWPFRSGSLRELDDPVASLHMDCLSVDPALIGLEVSKTDAEITEDINARSSSPLEVSDVQFGDDNCCMGSDNSRRNYTHTEIHKKERINDITETNLFSLDFNKCNKNSSKSVLDLSTQVDPEPRNTIQPESTIILSVEKTHLIQGRCVTLDTEDQQGIDTDDMRDDSVLARSQQIVRARAEDAHQMRKSLSGYRMRRLNRTAKIMSIFVGMFALQWIWYLIYCIWEMVSTPHISIIFLTVIFTNLGGIFNYYAYTYLRGKYFANRTKSKAGRQQVFAISRNNWVICTFHISVM